MKPEGAHADMLNTAGEMRYNSVLVQTGWVFQKLLELRQFIAEESLIQSFYVSAWQLLCIERASPRVTVYLAAYLIANI